MSETFKFDSHSSEQQRNQIVINVEKSADDFVAGTFLDGKEIVDQQKAGSIYRIFKQEFALPEISHTEFRLDCRKVENEKDQLRFEYTVPDEFGDQVPFAQMHLDALDGETFNLSHRYVKPEYRGSQSYGAEVLGLAELFVQRAADKKGKEYAIVVGVGQPKVMKWLDKMHYQVRKEDQALLEEIADHPDRFIQDDVILSQESTDEGIKKEKYFFRKDQKDRYMEDAVRLVFVKKFEPHQAV